MFEIPSIPSWDAFHPGISHFPMVLLLVVPIFILMGLLSPARRQKLIGMAFWFLLLGTVGVYLSASTGDAARDFAQRSPEITKAIEEHENIGASVRAVYSALTLLLSGFLFAPQLLRKHFSKKASLVLMVLFLVM